MTPRFKGSYTVLVVDDDPSVLATYRRLLRRAGYNTVTEGDPAKVLDDNADCGIDLLLIDYKMPGMDGLTLLAELRRRACRARCILISAFLNEDVRGHADDLGVDRVLEKPVDACMLRKVINDLLPLTTDATDGPNGRGGSGEQGEQGEPGKTSDKVGYSDPGCAGA